MRRIMAIIGLILLFIIISGSGCRKKVFQTDSTYTEEMSNFINNDPDGKYLFPKEVYSDGVFISNDTLIGDTTTQCFYGFDSTKRHIYVYIADRESDIYPFKYVVDGLAKIIDISYGNVYRISNGETRMAYKMIDSLTRYAYFVKLYNDSYLYRGWYLLGYIQGYYRDDMKSGNRKVEGSGDIVFSAVPPPGEPPIVSDTIHPHTRNFIMIDTIPKLPLDDSLTVFSNYRDVIFTEVGDSGIKALSLIPYQSRFKIGWRIPSVSSELYHLILFNLPGRFSIKKVGGIPDTTYIKTDNYLIPYKVDI